jgi:hypothetical protein
MSAQYKSEQPNSSNYTKLSRYNSDVSLNMCSFKTPDYNVIGYNALTHGKTDGVSQPYFNIQKAYGADKCATTFTNR